MYQDAGIRLQTTFLIFFVVTAFNVIPMSNIILCELRTNSDTFLPFHHKVSHILSEQKSTQGTFSVNSLILNKKDSHIKKKATVHNLIVFLNISIESKG